MRMGGSAFAALALLEIVVCVGAASCGIDTSGLGETTIHDSGTRPTSDASMSKDAGGGSDAPGATDTPTLPDVQQGDDGPSEDAPSLVDVASEAPPPPTCTACGNMECCNNATCAGIGNTTCGDPGQACVDCTNSPLGNQCMKLMGHQMCGCGGPPNSNQCPMNNACYNNKCGTTCDGQHPCNGGCCSGNDLATSTCVTSCGGGLMCQMNYCQ
jgi:hypothetical protein